VLAFGLKPAGLGFRISFITLAYLLFGLAFFDLPKFRAATERGLEFVFGFLLMLVFIRWFLVATGLYVNPDWGTSTSSDVRVPMRVIDPIATLTLGQIALIWLVWRRHQRVALLGLLVVLLLQIRSVWLATLVGAAFLAYRQFRAGTLVRITPRTLGLAALGLVLLAFGLYETPMIRIALEASATNEGTWVWRVASWAAALAPDQMPGWAWVIGKPFGTSMTRFMLGSVVNVSLHNHYVTVIVEMGLIGLVVWILLLGTVWYRSDHHSWGIMLVLTQLVFGIAYDIQGMQGFMLAIALAMVHMQEIKENGGRTPEAITRTIPGAESGLPDTGEV
jgi:hypothetical protein